jgi:uncharacterized protein YbjT (DUF2867 family)
MTLVTGAAGKTGRHILAALLAKGHAVRALAHSEEGRRDLEAMGVRDVVIGDMLDAAALARAMKGVRAVVHIGPAMHPSESIMGINVIDAAREAGVARFVFSSVAHPQIDALLNHQAKLPVERQLIESRLAYTILQPMHYMQNVPVRQVVETGVLALPYSLDVPMSFVDLADVGEAAAKVLSEEGHERATYELCGPDYLTYRQVAELIGRESGRKVEARRIPLETALANNPLVRARGEYGVLGFERLFLYYDRYGLSGNANVLRWLLGRPPGTYADYIKRELNRP